MNTIKKLKRSSVARTMSTPKGIGPQAGKCDPSKPNYGCGPLLSCSKPVLLPAMEYEYETM